MALQRTARIERVEQLSPHTRRFTLAMSEGEALGFKGGQYIIIDTGLPLPGGKVVKRPYSIVSCDAEQTRFELAVRKIDPGPGSAFMHALGEGASVSFSGPWGKLVSDVGAEDASTLIVATDTGITAALGLVQATALRPYAERTSLLWLVRAHDDFLPASFVTQRLPAGCSIHVGLVPTIGHPERALAARDHLQRWRGDRRVERAFLVGDGAVLFALRDALATLDVDDGCIGIECFFNNPARKAA